MRVIDITGQKFGRLTAVEIDASPHSRIYWLCRCDCGATISVQAKKLRNGHTKSCGCFRRDFTTAKNMKHGHAKTPTWSVWVGMRKRCLCVTDAAYPDYGGRGITICARWMEFENFLADMGERPPGMSIDRIDNDRGYEKANCRWATKSQQNCNTRRSPRLESHEPAQMAWLRDLGYSKAEIARHFDVTVCIVDRCIRHAAAAASRAAE